MANNWLTDEQVELEILRLQGNEDVRLAQKEIRIKSRRRKYMSQLRWLEKRGRDLRESGITPENMEEMLFGDPIPEGGENECEN